MESWEATDVCSPEHYRWKTFVRLIQKPEMSPTPKEGKNPSSMTVFGIPRPARPHPRDPPLTLFACSRNLSQTHWVRGFPMLPVLMTPEDNYDDQWLTMMIAYVIGITSKLLGLVMTSW
jgi:hypothetical protein